MFPPNYISWYLDIDRDPVVYGFTVWTAYYLCRVRGELVYQLEECESYQEDYHYLLTECQSGKLPRSGLAKSLATISNNIPIVLDSTPQMKTLQVELERLNSPVFQNDDPRNGTELEQTTRLAMMFESRLFSLNGHKIESDLIFDDMPCNLIDPVFSDEQTVFPMTQSILIACPFIEDCACRYF